MPCHRASERGGAWDLPDAKVNYYRVISACMIADCVNSAHSGRTISFKRGDFCANVSACVGRAVVGCEAEFAFSFS